MAVTPPASRRHFYQQIRQLLRRVSVQKKQDKAKLLQTSLELISPLSLDASPDEVSEVREVEGRWQVTVQRQGLTGALGALPTAYTQWLIERFYGYGERAGKAFLDIFTHRRQVLRFLAWEKSRFYARAELREEIPLSQASRSLSGVGNVERDRALLSYRYASLLSQPVRSIGLLECWLQSLFSAPAVIHPFQGSWQPVGETWLSALGAMPHPLGNAPVLGTQRWETQSHFRLVLGPIGAEQARAFMPGSDTLRLLHRSLQYFVGPGLCCDIELIIAKVASHRSALGQGQLGISACLGEGENLRRLYLPWELVVCQ